MTSSPAHFAEYDDGMDDLKGRAFVDEAQLAAGDGAAGGDVKSHHDVRDMLRLGKKQVFRRNFGFWATFGFTSIYIATWEYLLVSVYSGIINGGFAGLVYEYIGTSLCYLTIVLSLAEMASMAPTSGGQYHW